MSDNRFSTAVNGARHYTSENRRTLITAIVLVLLIVVAYGGWRVYSKVANVTVTAYFANSDGIYAGDNVKMMGVNVGAINSITPVGNAVKIKFHFDDSVPVPADAKAIILSPTLVSARSIQLAPAYTGGPRMKDGASIPIQRTAVPVEWDDFRKQLQELSKTLVDTKAGPRGPLGEFVSSAANALKGRGDSLNTTVDKLSSALGTLSDGRSDLFATVRNLQVFVSALASSDQQVQEFNNNLASVSSVLTDNGNELGTAVDSINEVTGNLARFVGENRDAVSSTAQMLARITSTLKASQPDIEQLLHVAPNAFANFYNIYQPAQGALTGALSLSQVQNPIQFICGAIQAASQEGAAESARRCAQYVGPVLKSLAVNYPPIGTNPISGADLRKNQIDYSEPALRPGPGQANTDVPGVFAPDTDSLGRSVKPGSGLAGLLALPKQGAPR